MIPATAAADAESQHQQQEQQQPQQQPVTESPSAIDYYYSSDWTGHRDGAASDEAEHIRDKMIDGEAMVDDANDIDRQVPSHARSTSMFYRAMSRDIVYWL